MSKSKNKSQTQNQKRQTQSKISFFPPSPELVPLVSFRIQAIVIILLGFFIYFNSFTNKYALDDDIVMRLNDYVQQGFSGIPKIMSTDAYDSFFRSMGSSGELSGGRYRPLSIVTFAIEQQLFGETYGNRYIEVKDSMAMVQQTMPPNPMLYNHLLGEKNVLEAQILQAHENIAMVRHIVSVLLYVFSVVLLLYLLRNYIFKYANLRFVNSNDLAFFTAIIFLVHPLHTEVVANVKSRDEILSLLFIVLTFIYVFKYTEDKTSKHLFLGLLFYFLALLSKEWGITLVILIPLAFYVFFKQTFGQSIKSSLPYIGVALFYLILRSSFVGAGKKGEITEVLNNPFVFATPVQALATKIYILVKYLRLLIYPHPLSADYSWKTIPYSSFGDVLVWFSVLIHLVIIYYFIVLYRKRNWIAFAIAFYLLHLFLVSNLAMPIGATMGERLIYHSSLGFIMIAAFALLTLINKIKFNLGAKKIVFVGLALLLITPMSYATIIRNPNWETDNILFMHDAWVVPNSVLANGNSGKAFIEYAAKDTATRLARLDSAIYHLDKAVALHPKYVNGYLNLGLAWFHKKDLDKAEYNWNQARRYFPTHPFFRQSYDPALTSAFIQEAKQYGKAGDVPKAIEFLHRALKYDSTNAETWYNYGGANYSIGNLDQAYRGFSQALKFNPNYPAAKDGINAILQRRQQLSQQSQK